MLIIGYFNKSIRSDADDDGSYSIGLLTRTRFLRSVWGVKQYFKLEHGLTHKQPLHLFLGDVDLVSTRVKGNGEAVGLSFWEDVCRGGFGAGCGAGARVRF